MVSVIERPGISMYTPLPLAVSSLCATYSGETHDPLRSGQVRSTATSLGPDGRGGRVGLLGKDIVPPSGDVGYYYDPSNPAPTYGGWIFQSAPSPGGVGCVDQSPLSVRPDVLQFNSLRLRKELAICGGDITATLTVSTLAYEEASCWHRGR